MRPFFLSENNRKEAEFIIGDSYSFKSYFDDLSLRYELESFDQITAAWLSDLNDAVNSPETASILTDLVLCDGLDLSYVDQFFDCIQQGAYSDFITVICSITASSNDTMSYQSLIKRCRDSGIVVASSNERAATMAKAGLV